MNTRSKAGPGTKKLGWCIAFTLLLCQGIPIANSRPDLEYEVKAAYLYNFLLFVEWPQEAFPMGPPTPMHICVRGEDPFGSTLDAVTQRSAQKRPILLHRLDPTDPLDHCHLIFISNSEQHQVRQLLRQVRAKNTLTVSDIADFADQGGIIGFVIKDGKVRLEVNLAAARTAHLKISSKLLEVATRIFGR